MTRLLKPLLYFVIAFVLLLTIAMYWPVIKSNYILGKSILNRAVSPDILIEFEDLPVKSGIQIKQYFSEQDVDLECKDAPLDKVACHGVISSFISDIPARSITFTYGKALHRLAISFASEDYSALLSELFAQHGVVSASSKTGYVWQLRNGILILPDSTSEQEIMVLHFLPK